jgi:hypothetical protein
MRREKEGSGRRVGVRLLLLLWLWAALMFTVVDLFLNVPAFDKVRPRAVYYRAARVVAHDLVGEPCADGQEGARANDDKTQASYVLDTQPLPRKAAMALDEGDWRAAWREVQGTETREIKMAGAGRRLGRALGEVVDEDPRSAQAKRTQWWTSQALKGLILRVRPEEEFGDAMKEVARHLSAEKRVEAVKEIENLLLRGLVGPKAVLSGEAAFDAIGPEVLPVIESNSREYNAQRAGYIVASLSTPSATKAILGAVERGSFPFVCVLREIHDPDSAPLLGAALDRARDFHLAETLVEALLQCGDPGLDELRRVAKGGPSVAFGPAVNGLSRGASEASDFDIVEHALELIPELATAVQRRLATGEYSDERATAFVGYLTSGRSALLKGMTAAFARWGDEAQSYVSELQARAPEAYREVVTASKAMSEETARALAATRR